jgi:SEC-C motif
MTTYGISLIPPARGCIGRGLRLPSGVDRLRGLSETVAAALRSAPVNEKAQLELAVAWKDVAGAVARVAERLRVRVTTWDPIGWVEEHEPVPVVAVERSGSGYGITLFVGAWTLDSPLLGTAAAEITALADSIVRVGAVNEASLISGEWVDLEEEGLVPPLLGALRLDDDLPLAQIELVKSWSPIDVPTVATVVAGAFGPLDLDLAPRSLSARPAPAPDCPACAGARYSVPFELDLARPAMCGPHRAEALDVMIRAMGQAEAENPEAWEVFAHAAADLLPGLHVPYPIRNRLLDAAAGVTVDESKERLLADRAEALLAFVEWVATPDRYESAMWDLGWRPLDGPARDDGRFDDFAHQVAYELGAAGQFPLAARVVDALVSVIPHAAANLHGELATQLGEAGRIEEARARLQLALEDPSRDLLTEIYAGEVDEAAGDSAGAEARYRSTLGAARKTGDALYEHEILWHLIELLQDDDERAGEVAELVRERDRAHARSMTPHRHTTVASPSAVQDFEPKVGRNEPCPCGSGRKFKRCHGGVG